MNKHRVDSLTDGIFAVAMTLLVIDLKLPESLHGADAAVVAAALGALIPKLVSWVISFLVLAFFWWGHHRAFHFVHKVDGGLVALNLLFLAEITFMPFASALSGEYPGLFAGQVVYSGTMLAASITAMTMWRYLYRHPELCEPHMPREAYRGAMVRTSMLVTISVAAVVLSWFIAGSGNVAFMLMMFSRAVQRSFERRDTAPPDDDVARTG